MELLENFPVTIGFIGVIIGALLVGFFQNKTYKAQRKDIQIKKKEEILDEFYRVYGRMSEIKFWQQEREFTGSDLVSAKKMLFEFEKERNVVLADQYSKLLTVNKLGELYFGDETQELIKKTFSPNNHNEVWWEIPNEQLNAITESIKRELERDIK